MTGTLIQRVAFKNVSTGMAYPYVVNAVFQVSLGIHRGDGLAGVPGRGQGDEAGTVVPGHLLCDSVRSWESGALHQNNIVPF